METFSYRRPLTNFRAFRLEAESELQVLTDDDRINKVSVLLETGMAEIYGVEMIQFKEYKYPPNSSVAVYTWHGCIIRITGKARSISVTRDNMMMINVVFHAYLQERRILAEQQGIKGPVTLIVGPADVGKTTLCRILLNYAARLDKRPMYVDLDVGQNSISMPGTVSVLTVDKTEDIVRGYEAKDAKVYHFGYRYPNHNTILYFLLLKHLGNVIKMGLRYANPNVRSSGVIINTCGWVQDHGYDAIVRAAKEFEINFLMVIGDEPLYEKVTQDMPDSVKVHYMPKLSGVIQRNRMLRAKSRKAKIREYFYGLQNPLYEINMHISEIKIFKVVTEPVPDGFDFATVALPNVKLDPVTLNEDLVGQVLAMMKIDIDETITENLALNEVMSFVFVKRVFIPTGGICLSCLKPRPLSSKSFLMGNIKV